MAHVGIFSTAPEAAHQGWLPSPWWVVTALSQLLSGLEDSHQSSSMGRINANYNEWSSHLSFCLRDLHTAILEKEVLT